MLDARRTHVNLTKVAPASLPASDEQIKPRKENHARKNQPASCALGLSRVPDAPYLRMGRAFARVTSKTKIPDSISHCRKSGAVNRAGIPKFDPPNPFRIANVIPITFPSEFNSGPPLPPTVV